MKTGVNDISIFRQAAALASGIMDKLGRPGHYTLFAPTNEAFENLSPGHLERMMDEKDVIAGMSKCFNCTLILHSKRYHFKQLQISLKCSTNISDLLFNHKEVGRDAHCKYENRKLESPQWQLISRF